MKITRWVVAAVLLWSSAALAQPATSTPSAAARSEASARFRRGVELFQEEAYRAALVEFQRAYEIAPDYRLLYNIAQTKLQVQDYVGAAQDYDLYLRQGGAAIPLERRTQVEGELAALRERVARISIEVNREGAEVFLDDLRIGTAPIAGTILANVGRHRVSARAADGANDARVIDLAAGDVLEVSLTLPEPVARGAEAPRDEKWSRKRKAALGTWIGGGALVAGAIVTGVMTKGAQDDLDKLLETRDVNRAEVADKRSSTKRLAATTDVLIGTAIASGVVGTLLWVYGADADETESEKKPAPVTRVRLNVGLGSLGLTGRFR